MALSGRPLFLHTFLPFFIHFHFFLFFLLFFLILALLGAAGETRVFAQVRQNTIILEIKSAQFLSLIF